MRTGRIHASPYVTAASGSPSQGVYRQVFARPPARRASVPGPRSKWWPMRVVAGARYLIEQMVLCLKAGPIVWNPSSGFVDTRPFEKSLERRYHADYRALVRQFNRFHMWLESAMGAVEGGLDRMDHLTDKNMQEDRRHLERLFTEWQEPLVDDLQATVLKRRLGTLFQSWREVQPQLQDLHARAKAAIEHPMPHSNGAKGYPLTSEMVEAMTRLEELESRLHEIDLILN